MVASDFRYAFRVLGKSPVFTATAILVLALSIGGNMAMFSLVSSVLLRPLPYKNPERLVFITETRKGQGNVMVSWPDFLDWTVDNRSFTHIAAIQGPRSLTLTGVEEPERLMTRNVSASFFSTLGVQPALGRDFSSTDDSLSAEPVVIISDSLWQRQFSSDPGLIGRSITLNNRSYIVVGILPADFQFVSRCDLFVPIGPLAGGFVTRSERSNIQVIARLLPGVSLVQARTDLSNISARLEETYPDSNHNIAATITTLSSEFSADLRPTLWALFGAVGFVLLIACVNLASLFIGRGLARSRELGIRLAIGASRGRIVAQLLAESLLIAGFGTVLGFLVGWFGIRTLGTLVPQDIQRVAPVRIDIGVVVFTIGVSVLTAIIFGLLPAVKCTRSALGSLARGARHLADGKHHYNVRKALVVAELAMTITLMTGTSLMLRSFQALNKEDPGFQPDRLVTLRIGIPQSGRPNDFFDRLGERIRQLPGVESYSSAALVPLTGLAPGLSPFSIDGAPFVSSESLPRAYFTAVEPAYFGTMRIPIVRGREFAITDDVNQPLVVVISAALAKEFFPNQTPIGKRLKFGPSTAMTPLMTIVGVVGDVKENRLDHSASPAIYEASRQMNLGFRELVIRTSAPNPLGLASSIQREVRTIDANVPVFDVRTMNYYVTKWTDTRKVPRDALGGFALFALLLSAVGIYGVLMYLVKQHEQEMAVRVALGATNGNIIRLVIGQGIRLVLFGLIIGSLGSLILTRFIGSMLFGIQGIDPLSVSSVAILLLTVAMMASYLPARAASRVNLRVGSGYSEL